MSEQEVTGATPVTISTVIAPSAFSVVIAEYIAKRQSWVVSEPEAHSVLNVFAALAKDNTAVPHASSLFKCTLSSNAVVRAVFRVVVVKVPLPIIPFSISAIYQDESPGMSEQEVTASKPVTISRPLIGVLAFKAMIALNMLVRQASVVASVQAAAIALFPFFKVRTACAKLTKAFPHASLSSK